MKKLKILIFILLFLFIANWTKQESSPEYCYGQVIIEKNHRIGKLEKTEDMEEIVDIKIGSSVDLSGNKDIIFYKKPFDSNENLSGKKLTEYTIDLNQVKEIITNSIDPIFKYEDKEYINATIVSRKHSKSIDCIIPKDKRVVGKLKSTGFKVSYPFDTIKKVIIQECYKKEDKEDN